MISYGTWDVTDLRIDINYWQHKVGEEDFKKEIDAAVKEGKVANIGSLRKLDGKEIEQARSKYGHMSSKV